MMVDVAAGTVTETDFATWIKQHLDPYATMPLAEFESLVRATLMIESEGPCGACSGSGLDLDGTPCIECRGEKVTVRVNTGMFLHSLIIRGLAELDEGDLAATFSLVNAFGVDWRKELEVPDEASPEDVWLTLLEAAASSPAEAAKYVAKWIHGT